MRPGKIGLALIVVCGALIGIRVSRKAQDEYHQCLTSIYAKIAIGDSEPLVRRALESARCEARLNAGARRDGRNGLIVSGPLFILGPRWLMTVSMEANVVTGKAIREDDNGTRPCAAPPDVGTVDPPRHPHRCS
jgi:hypothetical protein